MSGRGCTIVIKLLGGSTGDGEVEELSLPVALHSPLQVLKEQLMGIIGIPVQAQVLILCNLSDPDRNSDVLLMGRDASTLRTCGIRNGSTLTLHALGISNERKLKLSQEAWSKKRGSLEEVPRLTLQTHTSAADANHSYNGVIFDVESTGPYEVELYSVSVAGMLGRVRIYVRDRPWEDNLPERKSSARWWAERETIGREGWECIADRNCWPSWDKPLEIMFDKPVKLLPHSTRALYCHSSLPDDLGIQYQSYGKHDIVAEDEYLVVRPGLGHTGAEPFDEVQGWYRAYRALAGNLSYTVRRKGWTPFEHKIFPEPLKQAVKTLLMCQNQDHFLRSRSASIEGGTPSLSRQPSSGSSAPVSPLVAHGVNRSNSGCKGSTGGENEDEQPVQKMSGDDPRYVPPFAPQAAAVVNPVGASSSSLAAAAAPTDGGRSDRAKDLAAAVMQNLREACRGRRISELPVFVIYHILEYLHWDWFEESYDHDADDSSTGMVQSLRKRQSDSSGSQARPFSQGARGLLFQLVQQMGGNINASGVPGLQELLNYHYHTGGEAEYFEDEDGEEDSDSDFMDSGEGLDDTDDDDEDEDENEDEDEDEDMEEDAEEGEEAEEKLDAIGPPQLERVSSEMAMDTQSVGEMDFPEAGQQSGEGERDDDEDAGDSDDSFEDSN